jgi:transposase
VDRGHNEVVTIKFLATDCGASPARDRCTEARRRSNTVRPGDHYEAWQAARSREASAEYRAEYSRRAGIEGTLSQGVRTRGLRRSSDIGEAKAHLQHAAPAATSVSRISDWLAERACEVTRRSAFARLMVLAVAA